MTSKFKISGFKSFIGQLLAAHSKALFSQLDAVQEVEWNVEKFDGSATRVTQINYTYATMFAVFVATFLDIIFGLHYEHTGRLSIVDIHTSPYTVFHQVPQQIMWLQTDMILYANTFVTFLVYGLLVTHSYLPKRYRLYPVNEGRNLIVDSKGLFMYKCGIAYAIPMDFIF